MSLELRKHANEFQDLFFFQEYIGRTHRKYMNIWREQQLAYCTQENLNKFYYNC